ncbi:general stress protein [Paenibacillus sepulcri]|uniref:General stress protein n=1 Tax=Paenibacillus sepulcri TaxID=359917 RepID=A0ABS7C5Y6_9BACL|nr:general stress protein [Paenibacillus sepulcri]
MDKKIVGVFSTHEEAVRAIDDLKSQGYSSDDISIVAKNNEVMEEISEETATNAETGFAAGATTGGVVGGVTGLLAGLFLIPIPGIGPILAAGPIAATLTGLAVGAGAGGIVGGLIGLGIPEDEAKEYNDYVDSGKILVMVDSDAQRDLRAYDTFRTHNSLNAHKYNNYSR